MSSSGIFGPDGALAIHGPNRDDIKHALPVNFRMVSNPLNVRSGPPHDAAYRAQPQSDGPGYTFVASPEGLEQALTLFREYGTLSLDIESNSFYRYREFTCLIQAAAPCGVFIIDPLAVSDLSPLAGILADRCIEKIFHNADYDLRSLDRDYGFRVRNIFDTSIAAAFLGMKTLGLDRVLQTYINVEVEKKKSLQRSDWSKRPLAEHALQYAAQDVVHLLRLRNHLQEKLQELGRQDWAQEEFDRLESIRYTATQNSDTAWRQVKGLGKLRPEEKSIFRELYAYRDAEAKRRDRPPCKVLPNDLLMRLSTNPGEGMTGLPGMPRNAPPEFLSGLRDALQRGTRSAPYIEKSPPALPRKEQERIRENVRKLKEWRTRMATPLNLDPPLVWPTRHIELLARSPVLEPFNPEDEFGRPLVRSWQMEAFGNSLRECLPALRH